MIGGSATMIPERRGKLVARGPNAVVAGTMAALMTGAAIGLLTFA